MNKRTQAAELCRSQIRAALETVSAALNQGQRQKLMRDETVRQIYLRYGADTGEAADE